jgi:hypothetical protein
MTNNFEEPVDLTRIGGILVGIKLFNTENKLEFNPVSDDRAWSLPSHQRNKLDRKRPYKDKRLRKLLEIVYLHTHGPSTENMIRRHGLKGGNHREIHNDLEQLAKMGVCTKIPLGSGYVDLTKDGEKIALSIFNSKEVKLMLEFLDLHTDVQFCREITFDSLLRL